MPVSGSTRDIAAVKRAHPLAAVVAGYGVELRLSGRLLVARCPFHADGTPSFIVDPRDDHWHCFGCGAHGDVLDFVRRVERLDFRQALARLKDAPGAATPAGAPSPTSAEASRRAARERPRVWRREAARCLDEAAHLYAAQLWAEPAALAYAAGRGVEPEALRRFRVGFASGDTLADYLRWRGLARDAGRRAGLLLSDGTERFAGRIVVPELQGGVATWLIGRLLDDGHPKYLGLPGPKPLLGWGDAVRARRACLVEGVFDALVLRQWGYPAVALLGTSVAPPSLGLLGQLERVYLLLDADDAGRAATAALLDALGPTAVPVTLGGVADPADLALALAPRGRERLADALTCAGWLDSPPTPAERGG